MFNWSKWNTPQAIRWPKYISVRQQLTMEICKGCKVIHNSRQLQRLQIQTQFLQSKLAVLCCWWVKSTTRMSLSWRKQQSGREVGNAGKFPGYQGMSGEGKTKAEPEEGSFPFKIKAWHEISCSDRPSILSRFYIISHNLLNYSKACPKCHMVINYTHSHRLKRDTR